MAMPGASQNAITELREHIASLVEQNELLKQRNEVLVLSTERSAETIHQLGDRLAKIEDELEYLRWVGFQSRFFLSVIRKLMRGSRVWMVWSKFKKG